MSSSALPIRFTKDQDENRSLSIYSESLIADDVARIERIVQRIDDQERAAAGGEGRGASPWRWVEGLNYYMNIETGERSIQPPLPPLPPPPPPVCADADEGAERAEGEEGAAEGEEGAAEGEEGAAEGEEGAAEGRAVKALRSKDRMEIASFASVGEAYGHAARLAMSEERDASMTIQLRRACNFVKDGPIRVCIAFWIRALRDSQKRKDHRQQPAVATTGGEPGGKSGGGIRVLDLCCGRGQDFDKYRRICRDSSWPLEELVGIDVASGAALASAQDRWAQMDRHNHPVSTKGGVLSGDLGQGHAAMVINEAARRAGWSKLPEIGSFHMASCMFALHYFFKSEMSLRNLVAGAGFMVREGGFFACVHADGEAMAAAYLEHGKHPRVRVGQAKITFHEPTCRMLDGGLLEEFKDRPFGWAYDFQLPGAVENVTEYLVHSPTRDRIFEHYHFIKVFDESAETAVCKMRDVRFWDETFAKCAVDCDGGGRLAEETWDHLAMYRVVVYVKSPLKVDVNVVRNFIRDKMGFKDSGVVVRK